MTTIAEKIEQAAEAIKSHKPGFIPKVAIVLGSGLGVVADSIEDGTTINYSDIPNFQTSTVAGHAGNMILGYLKGTPVVCLQGRPHYYEGTGADVFKILIRTIKLIGCELLFLTNAAGSLREENLPGSLVMLNDHINFQFFNPIVGPNDEEFGERFFSMENAYDEDIRTQLKNVANRLDIKLAEGTYIAASGPDFETPAEIKAFQIMGADTVGMSTVPEVLVARHCNLKVAAISAITNMGAGMNEEMLSHEQTLRCAKLATGDLTKLILSFCEEYK